MSSSLFTFASIEAAATTGYLSSALWEAITSHEENLSPSNSFKFPENLSEFTSHESHMTFFIEVLSSRMASLNVRSSM